MPSGKVHRAISKVRTGFDFTELHTWIDKPYKEHGINHRKERHAYCVKDENTIRNRWGDKAVVEWLFHITLDNLETAYKKAQSVYPGKAYNFFSFGLLPKSKFIFFENKRLDEDEMKKKFKDSYYFEEETES